ncbi:magnesium-dependent phosphatase-1 [Zychaea mexicana]|uniref:magnesium-dependent phosphatase-1 n=1 Tax=Zychaea mexicana TaxID=64656 RepID=UPI0022FE7069|nr:magnesium-dependent phosphatase-1 [Zychaea mexicana]KAI9493457.1 magnesium-dependent phosphatase-1 [Zychaea mexicana]
MTITKLENQLPERLPKMVVFDLDYTIWETWIDCTSGPPFAYSAEENVIYGRGRENVKLFKDITAIFALIKSFPDTKIGIASRTHTPDWARAALKMLRVPELGGAPTLQSQIDIIEAYPSSKIKHFQALEKKSGISCEEMIFFDDEWRNKEVTTLGVQFNHVDTRKGVTMQQFMASLRKFDKESRYVQTKLDFSKH